MYKIETADYGFKLTFADFIEEDEIAKWVGEIKTTFEKSHDRFGIFVDMRNLKLIPIETQEQIKIGQSYAREKGMDRLVVILNNSDTTMLFKRIARETGIFNQERYIDASTESKWEEKGIAWLKRGTDPDKK